MKTLDTYTYNWAVEQVLALDTMGVLECGGRWDNPIENYLPDGVEYFSGASRMVFRFETLPGWVIKIDFKDTKGYCQREARFYKEAVEAHIEYCFASTYKLMELDDGRVAIIQESVDVDEDAISSSFYNYAVNDYLEGDERSEDSDYVWDVVADMDTRDRLYAIFGDDKRFNDIDDFCSENNINDLHEGNWGTTEDGCLVIMDFAGYGMI